MYFIVGDTQYARACCFSRGENARQEAFALLDKLGEISESLAAAKINVSIGKQVRR